MRQLFEQPARIAMRIVASGRSHRSKSGTTARAVRGFSFMEVMTAMFVVTVGLVTVITLFSKGFVNSATDRDRIVAAGLAQEGVEIVKNIRDNSLAIPGNVGFENFGPLTAHPQHDHNQCGLDYTDTIFDNSGGGQNCFNTGNSPENKFSLSLGANGFQAVATTQKWARVVYVFYNDNDNVTTTPTYFFDDSADVVSIVWWGGSSSPPSSVPAGNDKTKAIIDSGLSGCTASTKCVYATMHLDAWKP